MGKLLPVPKTEKQREMQFYEIRSLAELSEGRFGVREPKGGAVCVPKEGDLLLVPGLLFDGKKNRLGYGGGYYDTYFAKHKEGKRIGACVCGAAFRRGIADGGNGRAVRCSHNGKRMGGMKMSSLIEMGQRAKDAAVVLATLSTPAKNKALLASADALLAAKAEILAKNKADVDAAVEAGIKGAFIDRLTLTEARLADMAEGLRQVAKLDDPVGEVLSMKTLDNGLVIGQKRVPMGVIGIIFEARPNVAADAFGLCLKAGSAVILRGGKEAFQTNRAVISALRGRIGGRGSAGGLRADGSRYLP